MLSVRLSAALEEQLDFVSLATGIPKNTIVQQALTRFLANDELGRLPLAEDIPDTNDPIIQQKRFDRFNQRLDIEREQVSKLVRWVNERQIWTKSRSDISGAITPGIYGRNLVIGFNADNREDETLVISKNLPAYSQFGAPSYHYHITPFDDWLEWMRPVEIKKNE